MFVLGVRTILSASNGGAAISSPSTSLTQSNADDCSVSCGRIKLNGANDCGVQLRSPVNTRHVWTEPMVANGWRHSMRLRRENTKPPSCTTRSCGSTCRPIVDVSSPDNSIASAHSRRTTALSCGRAWSLLVTPQTYTRLCGEATIHHSTFISVTWGITDRIFDGHHDLSSRDTPSGVCQR